MAPVAAAAAIGRKLMPARPVNQLTVLKTVLGFSAAVWLAYDFSEGPHGLMVRDKPAAGTAAWRQAFAGAESHWRQHAGGAEVPLNPFRHMASH